MTPFLTHRIVGLAMQVQNELGNHHPEIVYHRAMLNVLRSDGLKVHDRPTLSVRFRGVILTEYVPDSIVRSSLGAAVIVDFKTCKLGKAEERQMLRYLTAYRDRGAVGLLINFGAKRLQWSIVTNQHISSDGREKRRRRSFPSKH